MSGAWKQVTYILLACSFIVTIILLAVNNFKSDSDTVSLTETLRSTAIANKDDSARMDPGNFYLNKETFEANFKQTIKKQPFYKDKTVSIDFDYLFSSNGKGIKAIRVFLKTDGNIEQATCILSTPKEG